MVVRKKLLTKFVVFYILYVTDIKLGDDLILYMSVISIICLESNISSEATKF